MSSEISKIIRDPIHEYISIYKDELPVIDSPAFQRLRNVRQNGTAYLTYPSCLGTRFEHSLGTKHLAGKMLASALEKSDTDTVDGFLARAKIEIPLGDVTNEQALTAILQLLRFAALLHDLGHPPFSHTLEELMTWAVEKVLDPADAEEWTKFREQLHGKLHEYLGILLLKRDPSIHKALGERLDAVVALLTTPSTNNSVLATLHEIVSFDIDADRSDYLVRDGQISGADFGNVDIDRIVESMRIHKTQVAGEPRYVVRPTIKALSAVEALLVERYKAYHWLYYHPKVVATNAVLREMCLRLYEAKLDDRSPLSAVGFDLRFGEPISSRVDSMKGVWFDDVYVVDALRRAHGICIEAATSGSFGDYSARELTSCRALLEELLFRARRGMTVWKDIKSYEEFDARIRPDIEAVYYEDQRRRHRTEYGSELPENSLDRLEIDEFALNWLARVCLASFGDRQGLQDQINARLDETGAFALLSSSFFKPLEYGASSGEYTVLGTDGRLYLVTDVSELLQHLEKVRRRDVLLHVYAVWPDDFPSQWTLETYNARRETIVSAVHQASTQWLQSYLEKGEGQ